MKNNNLEEFFRIDNEVNEEVYAETLVNLMKATYDLGFKEGVKSANIKKELDVVYEVVSDILDNEVMLITNENDKEFLEEELTNYLITLAGVNVEDKDNKEEKYLKNISRDYNIITRYIKLISLITNTKENR